MDEKSITPFELVVNYAEQTKAVKPIFDVTFTFFIGMT
jgi:hypothetical protein